MNPKKKGNRNENVFSAWLRDNGIKAFKDGASGGGSATKSDITNNIDANFECKAVKKINLQKAWQQTAKNAGMAHNTPYLAIHFDGMPPNKWLMVMDNDDWLDLLKKDGGIKTDYIDPKLKYDLQILKENCRKVIKKLE